MSDGTDTRVLGIVVLARGGDRQTLYLDPDTYFSSLTTITPLGEVSKSLYLRPVCGSDDDTRSNKSSNWVLPFVLSI